MQASLSMLYQLVSVLALAFECFVMIYSIEVQDLFFLYKVFVFCFLCDLAAYYWNLFEFCFSL